MISIEISIRMIRVVVGLLLVLGMIYPIVQIFYSRTGNIEHLFRRFFLFCYLFLLWVGILDVTGYWKTGSNEQHIDWFSQLSGIFWILVPTYAFACYWGPPKILIRLYFFLKNKRDQPRLQF